MFVTLSATNQKAHKKALCKYLNDGMPLTPSSFNRIFRVRGDSRFSGGGSGDKETLIERAFRHGNDGRAVYAAEDDISSGTDLLKADDYCLVIVRAQTEKSSSERKTKPTFMLLCKFRALSDTNKRSQLDLYQ